MANNDVPIKYLKKQFLQLANANVNLDLNQLTLKQHQQWESSVFTQISLLDKIKDLQQEQDEDLEESVRRRHRFTKLKPKVR